MGSPVFTKNTLYMPSECLTCVLPRLKDTILPASPTMKSAELIAERLMGHSEWIQAAGYVVGSTYDLLADGQMAMNADDFSVVVANILGRNPATLHEALHQFIEALPNGDDKEGMMELFGGCATSSDIVSVAKEAWGPALGYAIDVLDRALSESSSS